MNFTNFTADQVKQYSKNLCVLVAIFVALFVASSQAYALPAGWNEHNTKIVVGPDGRGGIDWHLEPCNSSDPRCNGQTWDDDYWHPCLNPDGTWKPNCPLYSTIIRRTERDLFGMNPDILEVTLTGVEPDLTPLSSPAEIAQTVFNSQQYPPMISMGNAPAQPGSGQSLLIALPAGSLQAVFDASRPTTVHELTQVIDTAFWIAQVP